MGASYPRWPGAQPAPWDTLTHMRQSPEAMGSPQGLGRLPLKHIGPASETPGTQRTPTALRRCSEILLNNSRCAGGAQKLCRMPTVSALASTPADTAGPVPVAAEVVYAVAVWFSILL